jgi:hypothetical protein
MSIPKRAFTVTAAPLTRFRHTGLDRSVGSERCFCSRTAKLEARDTPVELRRS